MGKANRKTMQIDKELLSEKNYTGSRLILIENEDLKALHEEIISLQKEANPYLDKLQENYYSKVDPLYQESQRLMNEAKKVKEQIAELTALNQPDIDMIESIEKRANLVKDKMQPIIMEEIKDKLGEFEIARHTTIKDGGVYAEVFDEIEEKIKAIRAQKLKK